MSVLLEEKRKDECINSIDNNLECLDHFTKDVVLGVDKTKLCSFAVALEGWRRGLELKWYTKDAEEFKDFIVFGVNPPGRLFSLSSNERTHYFFRTRGDKVSNLAVEICADKDETKNWLERAGVPVPFGRRFDETSSDEEIILSAEMIGFPLVLKPTNGSLGEGVITNIRSAEELAESLVYVRQQLGYSNVIMEQFIPGEEYRVYVVDGKVIAAYNRIPSHVIGDGRHTIDQLIELKNEERKVNPRLASCLIEKDQEVKTYIKRFGYSYDSVPSAGEEVFLLEKSNVSSGGDPVDYTDKMPEVIKDVAIKAVNAIPGLIHGGVDIIVNGDIGVVIELNPTAQIGGSLFPVEGQARDIPKAIIDYYFPETVDSEKTSFYFDLKKVLQPLYSRIALEVKVSPPPSGKVYAKRFVLQGEFPELKYHMWLRKRVFEHGLNGYAKTLANGSLEIIIAGTDKDVIGEFKSVFAEPQDRAVIDKVEEYEWDRAVKIGFDITAIQYKVNLEKVLKQKNKEIEKLSKQLTKSEKVEQKLEKQLQRMQRSRVWRMTLPLRTCATTIKRLIRPRKPV
ncbi:ATP-grasp domain-containing protein [Alkalihalobacterium chitinilyticum]|uniref:Acylphosphatase n=1 Tax=Alkalihalobacterium chitinilyticum TaxID=2980103 RepID=A0ABT5VMU8_9BACI|nr:ATP-grasp domain-containing protein [Alkalihalobacterium chitinilyticum]MDE5415813.1 ATP-grasp domain-containing protein [Alkalihalobacterium chitinilyticum]